MYVDSVDCEETHLTLPVLRSSMRLNPCRKSVTVSPEVSSSISIMTVASASHHPPKDIPISTSRILRKASLKKASTMTAALFFRREDPSTSSTEAWEHESTS